MDTSPTGTPFIPPQYVPLLVVAMAALNSGLVALSQAVHNATAHLVITVLLATLSPIVAAISPGLRKADGSLALKKGASTTAKVLLCFMCLAAGTQQARAANISSGPTIPLVQLRLADPATKKAATSLLQAGAGYQLSFGFAQRAIAGKQFDLIDLNLAFFGSAGNEAGSQLDMASVAGLVCTLNSLLCMGMGVDLVQYYGGNGGELSGLLAGAVGRQNVFALLSVGFNFEVGPMTPPLGIETGVRGLERGNTVYF